jgi:hypothetical protein
MIMSKPIKLALFALFASSSSSKIWMVDNLPVTALDAGKIEFRIQWRLPDAQQIMTISRDFPGVQIHENGKNIRVHI